MQLVILGDYSQLVSLYDTRNMLINSRELISQLVCLRHTRRSYVYDILHNPQLVLLCNTRKDTGSSGKLTSPLIETRQLTFGSYRWLSAVYTHIVFFAWRRKLCSHTTEVSQPKNKRIPRTNDVRSCSPNGKACWFRQRQSSPDDSRLVL